MASCRSTLQQPHGSLQPGSRCQEADVLHVLKFLVDIDERANDMIPARLHNLPQVPSG